ncbi:hypothetical protein GO009_10835 [Muricauda sp. TY007]|uniref:hypothetical protein n=1 Tax=Allomuricauda sp. TY007 TaxID=2683200 RepID=UPI0013BFA77B|nr:hypothetical protein [Muricauda sp. TY007]NDV16522.1 hypothetical protein [Muricauda sp. TY007]
MRTTRIILIPVLFVFLCGFGETLDADKVYICKGKGSKKYHYNKHCRGLSRCSTKIYEVTLEKAKEMGRTLCGWED